MAYDQPLPVEEHPDHFLRIQLGVSGLNLLVMRPEREMVVDRVVVFGGTPGSSAIKLSHDEEFIQDSGSTYVVGTNSSGVNASSDGESLEITGDNVVPAGHYLTITGGGSVTAEIWLRSKRK